MPKCSKAIRNFIWYISVFLWNRFTEATNVSKMFKFHSNLITINSKCLKSITFSLHYIFSKKCHSIWVWKFDAVLSILFRFSYIPPNYGRKSIINLSYDRDFWLFVKNDARSKKLLAPYSLLFILSIYRLSCLGFRRKRALWLCAWPAYTHTHTIHINVISMYRNWEESDMHTCMYSLHAQELCNPLNMKSMRANKIILSFLSLKNTHASFHSVESMIPKVWVIFGFILFLLFSPVLDTLFHKLLFNSIRLYQQRELFHRAFHRFIAYKRKHWNKNQRLTIKINKRAVYKWAILVRFSLYTIPFNEWVEWRQWELFNIYWIC